MTIQPAVAPRAISAGELAVLAGGEAVGCEGLPPLESITTLEAPADRAVVFRDRFSEDDAQAIDAYQGADTLFVLPPDYRGRISRPALLAERPRHAISAIIAAMFDYYGDYWTGFEMAEAAQARRPGIRLMPGCLVHPTATIGEGALVFPGAVIGPRVHIGCNAFIKANAVIGLPGFGVYTGPAGGNQHLPHIGGVSIGDNVEIGALNTVCSGTIHPTILEDRVKMDDHVHVAHNCRIGADSQLTAHTELSGSTVIGSRCVLSPNCSTVNGINIGAGSIVGIAANVTKNVEPGMVVVGNPARQIRPVRPSDRA